MTGLIYRPLVTEKISKLQDKGLYAFEVNPKANKIDIARAIAKKFNVTVVNVRTMNYKGKSKTQMTRKGRFAGKTSHFKKAIITLPPGSSLKINEAV